MTCQIECLKNMCWLVEIMDITLRPSGRPAKPAPAGRSNRTLKGFNNNIGAIISIFPNPAGVEQYITRDEIPGFWYHRKNQPRRG